MSGWFQFSLFVVCLAYLPLGWSFELVDDLQVVVQFKEAPLRIVSLLPSLTETVCELGQCHRLVGVDRYSNYPPAVKKLSEVGGGLDPNIEAIVALRPDVVLMAVSSRSHERLTALGVKVVALETKNHADVRRVLEKVGQMLEIPAAQGADRVWRLIDAGINAAAQSVPKNLHNVSVYFEVNRAPFAAGTTSFIGETLVRLHAKNIIGPEMGPFPKINPEYVVRANPEIIMVGDRAYQGMTDRPGWSSIRAVKNRSICVFKPDDSDVLVRPGPRMAEGARIMANCLSNARTYDQRPKKAP
jgi:iron complex transport system substrate-binding protein